MRVWDIDPRKLCRRHLLAQHNEIHGIWSIIVNERRGYAHHPETNRWRGRLGALHVRHAATAGELIERGFRHNSPLPDAPLADACEQPLLLETIEEQYGSSARRPAVAMCDLVPSRQQPLAWHRSPTP